MAAATEVREGFLCPMCMKDLGNVTMLQGHFEEEHSTEDKDVLQQLRGNDHPLKKIMCQISFFITHVNIRGMNCFTIMCLWLSWIYNDQNVDLISIICPLNV